MIRVHQFDRHAESSTVTQHGWDATQTRRGVLSHACLCIESDDRRVTRGTLLQLPWLVGFFITIAFPATRCYTYTIRPTRSYMNKQRITDVLPPFRFAGLNSKNDLLNPTRINSGSRSYYLLSGFQGLIQKSPQPRQMMSGGIIFDKEGVPHLDDSSALI